jgi:hypothetical protein
MWFCRCAYSGVRYIIDVIGVVVPDSQCLVEVEEERRKRLCAARIFALEKEAGITFFMADRNVIDKLVELEDVDVSKREVRERVVVNQ